MSMYAEVEDIFLSGLWQRSYSFCVKSHSIKHMMKCIIRSWVTLLLLRHLLFFASLAPWWEFAFLFSKTAPSAKLQKENKRPRQLSAKMKNLWQQFVSPFLLTAHMSAPRSPLRGLLQLSVRLGVQVKRRKRQTRTCQQMMRFNAGSESSPGPRPAHLALIRVEARIFWRKYTCRCLFALFLWQVSLNRLRLLSTDT